MGSTSRWAITPPMRRRGGGTLGALGPLARPSLIVLQVCIADLLHQVCSVRQLVPGGAVLALRNDLHGGGGGAGVGHGSVGWARAGWQRLCRLVLPTAEGSTHLASDSAGMISGPWDKSAGFPALPLRLPPRQRSAGAALTRPFCQAIGLHSRSLRPPHTLQVNWTSRERRGSCRSILTASSSPLSLPPSLPPFGALLAAAPESPSPLLLLLLAGRSGTRSSSLELSTSAAVAAGSCCG